MATLELTDDEQECLLDILRIRLGELRQEVHHCMVSTYTDQLKERAGMLRGVIKRLEAPQETRV